jgi:hypothetical protein
MTGFSRRSFMTLASGLLLPYEPERVYSFVKRRNIERMVWVEFLPRATWNGIGWPPINSHGYLSDDAEVGQLVGTIGHERIAPLTFDGLPAMAIGRVSEVVYVEHFEDGSFETRSHV